MNSTNRTCSNGINSRKIIEKTFTSLLRLFSNHFIVGWYLSIFSLSIVGWVDSMFFKPLNLWKSYAVFCFICSPKDSRPFSSCPSVVLFCPSFAKYICPILPSFPIHVKCVSIFCLRSPILWNVCPIFVFSYPGKQIGIPDGLQVPSTHVAPWAEPISNLYPCNHIQATDNWYRWQ